MNTYRNTLLFVFTTCVFIGHIKASEQTPAAPMPASSTYPDSSGPIEWDPALTLAKFHDTIEKHPTTKKPTHHLVNDNDYIVSIKGKNTDSFVGAKDNVWIEYLQTPYSACPLNYYPKDTDTNKAWTVNTKNYKCILVGSDKDFGKAH